VHEYGLALVISIVPNGDPCRPFPECYICQKGVARPTRSLLDRHPVLAGQRGHIAGFYRAWDPPTGSQIGNKVRISISLIATDEVVQMRGMQVNP
jgi:hypothetical protein